MFESLEIKSFFHKRHKLMLSLKNRYTFSSLMAQPSS
ncbi:hypothetical protein BM43_2923 [Burkholderia gladioli]|uniref:Uncharacterized protein n=1 Tax=Burkholderia gladioli TaxID=28095 RepID=A0AAW3ETT1_BURGA|nr:hypothetical protein BM43_2923 [Burkholderia gladioli]KGC10522.1 hypothetical protein DM48_5973 [Burkholderia gladioli]SPV21259.1 Uncharacterised protein [Burkholderia gladioli]